MILSNYQKWRSYTANLSSPENFIDWSYYFVIAAALQRRVAFGGDPKTGRDALFPNIYVVLVGKAGVGKGIVIGPATELLKYHLKKDFKKDLSTVSEQEKLVINAIEDSNTKNAEESTTQLKGQKEKIDPTLFPYAPDATTYEKFVEDMGKSFRYINYKFIDDTGAEKIGVYGHCSMYAALPELGSLLRKRTEDTVNFTLGLYDCPLDYEYKTVTRQSDRIRRGCLNILAGTTPEFMETIFNANLIDQGFSSRAFFIYAPKNRKNVGIREPLTSEQLSYRTDLLAHIKKLAGLYGQVHVTTETRDWFNNWWDATETNRHKRANKTPKLDPYYGRKNIHVLKLAMILHFSESTDMMMPLERIQEAIKILENEEKSMHMALTFETDNPVGKLTDKVRNYIINNRKVTMVELVTDHWKELPDGKKSMEEVLDFLCNNTREIYIETEKNEDTGITKVYYMPSTAQV